VGPQLNNPAPSSLRRSLPTIRVGDVEPLQDPSDHWLIEELWSARAVGVLGGAPKLGKTWTAVDLALSVASGTPALGRFAVKDPGTVLFFAAEDPPPRIRERFAAIARYRGLEIQELDVHLLDVPVLKLDSCRDRRRLQETVRTLRPKLLVIDPLVRTHSIDENSSTAIAALLSFLRRLERHHETAILITHHTRKNAPPGQQPGLGLRGSSDIAAFGDSNLYLRRSREHIVLTVEHRAAPSPESIRLALVSEPVPHLEIVKDDSDLEPDTDPHGVSFSQEVLWHLQQAPRPLHLEEIRNLLRARKQRVSEAVRTLIDGGFVHRTSEGFLADQRPAED
jgi:hypothetical protein